MFIRVCVGIACVPACRGEGRTQLGTSVSCGAAESAVSLREVKALYAGAFSVLQFKENRKRHVNAISEFKS